MSSDYRNLMHIHIKGVFYLAKTKLKTIHKLLLGVFIIVFVLGIASYIYVSDYYRASDYVDTIIEEQSERVTIIDNLTVVTSAVEQDEKIGLIFYPGGKVEAEAYMPLLLRLSERAITTVLVEMPVNLAVFDINAASDVISQNLDVDKWYLAGHSLGGAMASQFVEENYDLFEGLILLGAYPINEAPIDTLAIYGTYDIMLDLEKTAKADEVFEIIDGNHANFGDYGFQEGDGEALISREDQQMQAVDRIESFIFK